MSVEEKYAYAAGLFDGEGCVVVAQRHTQQWTFELQLSNCDNRALKFMVKMFGGKYRSMIDKKTGRSWGLWVVTSGDAENAARQMLPYSILKKEQLKLFLEIRKTVGSKGHRISPATHTKRLQLTAKINSFKRPQWVMQ